MGAEVQARQGQAAGDLVGDSYCVDAVIVGAGMSGIAQLYKLREIGIDAIAIDVAQGVGGTWYWNRYPGARLDSESYTYGYFFSREIIDEWVWTEEFASQPELERYTNFVVDRLGLRPHLRLGQRVESARYDRETKKWWITADNGSTYVASYLISAVGILSTPIYPQIRGLDRFNGACHHTGRWPHDTVDFVGQRVAVIGTGSSGIQVIQSIYQEVEKLVVFQRTPNWVTPLNNRPIDQPKMFQLRRAAETIHARCMSTVSGFVHEPRSDSILDVEEGEREAYLEELYKRPGMSMLFGNFSDITRDQRANDLVNAFIERKIRSRVARQDVADLLVPTDHGYGQKRPPLETGYVEAFNEPHVELVNLSADPIVDVTGSAIVTTAYAFDVDIIVLATGFDAVTGSITRLNVTNAEGTDLSDDWQERTNTFLGICIPSFPNFFMIGGPTSVQGNNPRLGELQVDWITRCIDTFRGAEHSEVEPTVEAKDRWLAHVDELTMPLLSLQAQSWGWGSNVPGKSRSPLLYPGGMLKYASILRHIEDNGYAGFVGSDGELPVDWPLALAK
jgi:cation diffusion facilitator CzcD-associated flavoprotein CzcO